MSNEPTIKQAWAEKLASESIDDQVTALRQISGQENITGLTVSIVRLAGSSDDEVRMWSAEALESAVKGEPSEATELIGLLKDAVDGEISYWAATMLGRLGSEASGAADALEACLRESMYLPARERATWALTQIGAPAAVAIEALREASETAPPRLRRLAAEALREITGQVQGGDSEDAGEIAA